MRREELLTLLWPDGTDQQLKRRLSQLIYSIHQRVQLRVVQGPGDRYALDKRILQTDFQDFLIALRERLVNRAADLVSDGFLSALERSPTWEFEHWVEEREGHFRSEVRSLASEAWSEGEQTSDWVMAEQAARAWLTLDPREEGVLRKLLTAMALRGKVKEAEARYTGFRETGLLEDSGWDPETETKALVSHLDEIAARRLGGGRCSVLRGVDEPPLVGRRDHLRRLAELLGRPPTTGLRLVIVSGEGGVGKTRLVREALAGMPIDGARVLEARCAAIDQNVPLSPIISALEPEWAWRSISDLGSPWDRLLAKALPQCRTDEGDRVHQEAVSPEDVPSLTREAVMRLLRHLTGFGPLVLFFDDVQWMDPTSLAVLEHLRDCWDGQGCVLVVVVRPEAIEEGANLSRWITAAPRRDHEVEHVSLGRLALEETRKLVSHAIRLREGEAQAQNDEEQVDALVELADGHPLLALECVLGWEEDGGPDMRTRFHTSDTVRRAVARRMAKLSQDARGLLSALSPSDKPLSMTAARRAADTRARDFASALDEAVSRRFLSVSARGVEFRHGLIRAAVYREMPLADRANAHRALADVLRLPHSEGTAMDIALHLFAAAEPQAALPYALEGAEAAMSSGGWAEARSLLETALDTAPAGALKAQAASLVGRITMLEGSFFRAVQAFEIAENEFRTAGEHEQSLLSGLKAIEARALIPDSASEELLRRVREIRRYATEAQLGRLQAECMSAELRILDGLRRVGEAKNLAVEARSRKSTDDVEARLQFLFVSMHDAVFGNPQVAEKLAAEAAEIADAHGLQEALLKALNWQIIASGHQATLNLDAGRELIARAVRTATKTSDPEQRFHLHTNVGVWHLDVGEHPRASDAFRRAAQVLASLPAPQLRRTLLFNQGQLALEHGDLGSAESLLNRSLEGGGVAAYGPHRSLTLCGIGLLRLYSGDLAAARTVLNQLPPRPDQWTFDPFLWVSLDVRVHLASGSRKEAFAALDGTAALKNGMAASWIRLQLLRLELMARCGVSTSAGEVKELERFLVDRKLDARLDELRRIAARGGRGV